MHARKPMASTTPTFRERLRNGESIDLRGYGKAGGGLVLAVQAFGEALSSDPALDVQDWPLFSSARKGANVCAYLRIAQGRVENTSRVSQPDIALLMNEAAGRDVDFAEGTDGALYVVNTASSPEETGARYHLNGTVATVDGDALGLRHLQRPLPNVAVLAALLQATALVDGSQGRASLEHRLEKRRVPRRIIQANLDLFDDTLAHVRTADVAFASAGQHRGRAFQGYGALPVGAQSLLRTSLGNRTAAYGRPGVATEFRDETKRCNGCSLCVVQCPEGIIEFDADPARGPIVRGARFDTYCKTCRECIAACPLDLFREVATVAPPELRPEGS